MKTIDRLFEKLLPSRWWKAKPRINDEQFWNALNATVNPQTEAVLHIATDKFVAHTQMAADVKAPPEERLRSLDRALAVADFLEEVERNMGVAKQEVERRAQGAPESTREEK